MTESDTTLHRNAVKVADALAAAGATGRVRQLTDSARTAADAAAALGCPVGAIANSLVFAAGGAPLLVLTSGAHRVDTAHLGRLLSAAAAEPVTVERADADFVRAATGQPIGGVAPLGHPAPLRTLVDRALADYAVVWAAAGTPHAVFPTTFDELVRITGGGPVDVVPD